MNPAAIGIFDSGLGGLSVWRVCKELLPNEQFIYVADQAHCPYGPQAQDQIIKHCERIVYFLLRKKVKLVVLACNTATAAAISHLRYIFDIPFVGIEPALKPAVENSKSGVIGILATEGTFKGNHFKRTREKFAGEVEVLIQVGHGLVEEVEKGNIHDEKTLSLLQSYLEPMKAKGADQIVLGCTHYPFLQEPIQNIMGPRVQILDPAPAIARQTQKLLNHEGLGSENIQSNEDEFYTSAFSPQHIVNMQMLSERLNLSIEGKEWKPLPS